MNLININQLFSFIKKFKKSFDRHFHTENNYISLISSIISRALQTWFFAVSCPAIWDDRFVRSFSGWMDVKEVLSLREWTFRVETIKLLPSMGIE